MDAEAERIAAPPPHHGGLPVDERDPDLGAVEQTGAHLVLHDAALGERPDQIEIVDREPSIAPNRPAFEAGFRPVDLAAEHDVGSWSVKKNCAPSFLVIPQIAASDINFERLKLLHEYTKFHIALYVTLIALMSLGAENVPPDLQTP